MPPATIGPDIYAASGAGEFTSPDPGDAGTITLRSGITSVALTVGTGSETRTVPLPTGPGMVLILSLVVDGTGTIAITFDASVDSSGNTIATFGELDDSLILHSVPVAAATTTTGFAWVNTEYSATCAFS